MQGLVAINQGAGLLTRIFARNALTSGSLSRRARISSRVSLMGSFVVMRGRVVLSANVPVSLAVRVGLSFKSFSFLVNQKFTRVGAIAPFFSM